MKSSIKSRKKITNRKRSKKTLNKPIPPREQYSDIDPAWFPPDWNGDWDNVSGMR